MACSHYGVYRFSPYGDAGWPRDRTSSRKRNLRESVIRICCFRDSLADMRFRVGSFVRYGLSYFRLMLATEIKTEVARPAETGRLSGATRGNIVVASFCRSANFMLARQNFPQNPVYLCRILTRCFSEAFEYFTSCWS